MWKYHNFRKDFIEKYIAKLNVVNAIMLICYRKIYTVKCVINLLANLWEKIWFSNAIMLTNIWRTRLCFYQSRSAWSMDQGSNKNHSPPCNFAPTVTKCCVMWEGSPLPHDTKFCNCRCKIVDSKAFSIWSLIHELRWSGMIKAEPGNKQGTSWFQNILLVVFWK